MTENEPVIKVQNISKAFKLPHEKQSSIKSLFVNMFRGKRTFERQQVLKNISFEVNKGDFFGIVGRNGSGKSTLLKLLAGIYAQDKGDIDIRGTLTPFIELGVGFNPDLTGRENVFLNGALLGFSRKEMLSKYNEIVEFAELGRFMDQALKNYSSGMQVRLAFSIAIQVSSNILLLDEVLAVGDEAFQQKCIDIFESYKANKQTIVLVTHDMDVVRKYCNRALLLDSGEIKMLGDPEKISFNYSDLNQQVIEKDIAKKNTQPKKSKSKIKLTVTDANNQPKHVFGIDEPMRVKVHWPKNTEGVKNVAVAIVKNSGELMFGTNTLTQKDFKIAKNSITYSPKLAIGPGKYHLAASIFGRTKRNVIDFQPQGPEFMVVEKKPNQNKKGLVRLDYDWS